MDSDLERDYAEESYWRHFCAECDGPCRSTDGHVDLHVSDNLERDHADALAENAEAAARFLMITDRNR